jgi:hypothetical protein
MPPLWRNQRTPTGADTPAATPASSLDSPQAIAARTAAGAHGARPAAGQATASAVFLPGPQPNLVAAPCTHLQIEVLQRPVESALHSLIRMDQPLQLSLAAPDGHLQGVQARSVRSDRAACQPTMKRLKASTTKATYTKPDQVAT